MRFVSSRMSRIAERERGALGALEGGGDIREGEQEANDVLAMGHDLDQAVIREVDDIVHGVLNVALRERVVLPVVDEGLVVGLADAPGPLEQLVLALEVLDLQVAALHARVRRCARPAQEP